MPNYFTAFVDGYEIIKYNRETNKETVVGAIISEYDALLKRLEDTEARAEQAEAQADEFYDKLVDHGIIEDTRPKSPEKIQQEMMSKILDKLNSIEERNNNLEKELKSLKKGSEKNERSKNASGETAKQSFNSEKV